MIIGIKCHFDAAHYLPNYPGKCREMHGHTWTVEVEVIGEVNYNTGMVMDFSDIKPLIARVLEKLDHKVLNDVLPQRITETGIYGCIPTCENVAIYLKKELSKIGLDISIIKVQEGDGGWAII